MKISVIIPAYNEEQRIEKTLRVYHRVFEEFQEKQKFDFNFIIVLNGCTDHTYEIVEKVQNELSNIEIIELGQAGKGRAIKAGFLHALKQKYDLIGFVDADMATRPEYFYDLIKNINNYDGVIASRYMAGSQVYPPRPLVKRLGRYLIYNSLVKLLFGLWFKDLQCGAKLFKWHVIKTIIPYMSITQWAFDVELLYLCKKFGFKIREMPTVWHDQADSKLRVMHSGMPMLTSLFKLRLRYSRFNYLLSDRLEES